MESRFEKLVRHVDPSHFDATSHETPVLPNRSPDSDPLSTFDSGDYPEDSESQISAATSWHSEGFSFSAFWG